MYATSLTPTLAHHAEELMNSRKSFMQVPPEMEALQKHLAAINMRNVLDPYFSDLGTAFGVWSDDGQMMWGLLFTLFSNQQPCYYLNKAYTRPDAPIGTLAIGFERMVEHHEELGYKRFYTLYPKSIVQKYRRLWRASTLLKDYTCYTDYESAPNERPKFSEFWECLYGRMLYNEDMVVRGFVKT